MLLNYTNNRLTDGQYQLKQCIPNTETAAAQKKNDANNEITIFLGEIWFNNNAVDFLFPALGCACTELLLGQIFEYIYG